MVSRALTKILWAIDPYDGWPRQIQPIAEVLRNITQGRAVAIHPVSFFPSSIMGKAVLEADDFRATLENALAALRLPGLRETRLVVGKNVTTATFAKTILSLVESERADAIAITTHGRTGFDRWHRGSYTETLLRKSPVPVLVLNPTLRAERNLDSVLVPSDFSPASRAAYETAVAIAADRRVPIILLHENRRFDGEAVDPAYLWTEWARERGVTVRVKLESLRVSNAEAIVACAKEEGAGLIAMATQSSALRAALGGSTAKSVVRAADCPVLVWSPRRVL